MSIVLVNHYAGDGKNGMEYRPYFMAKKWVEAGESVTIVASSYSHLRTKNPYLGNANYKEEIIDGINYFWIKGNRYSGNGFGRILNMIAFVRGLYRYLDRIVDGDCDAIIASSTYPLDVYPSIRIAKKKKIKFIFELHDMWPESPMELGNMSKWHPFICLMRKAETKWIREADEVVSLLPEAERYLIERGMKEGIFHYIPNGINCGEWAQQEPIPEQHEKALSQIKERYRFIVGYAGTHGIGNALDMMLDVAERLKNENIAFVLVGEGSEKENLIDRAKKAGIQDVVTFLPAVRKQEVPELLSYFDALFTSAKDRSFYRYGTSANKLIDYMMAAKPVIYAINTPNDYVKDAGCGVSIPSGDIDRIAEETLRLSKLDSGTLEKMGKKGRSYIRLHNDYDGLARDFLKVIKER